MRQDDALEQRLLALVPSGPPVELRAKALARAVPELAVPATWIERADASRTLRWGWAACMVLVLLLEARLPAPREAAQPTDVREPTTEELYLDEGFTFPWEVIP